MKTHEIIDICMKNYHALKDGTPRTSEMRTYSNLRNACELFSRTAFENIRTLHAAEKEARGLSAVFEKFDSKDPSKLLFTIKVLTYCVAGRIMVTVKNEKEDSITLLGGEDKADSIAGFHAIDCEPDIALDMLEILTDEWYVLYDKRGVNNVNKFETDKTIKIAGM